MSDWIDRPGQDADPGEEKAGGRVIVLLLLGLVVLFGGLYVGAYAFAGDDVPRGTTVSGVDIGGLSKADARRRLRAQLAERADRPITASIDGDEVTLRPSRLGLEFDYAASLSEAGTGRSWNPVRLWRWFTGGEELRAEVSVDEAEFGEALVRLNERHGRDTREGRVGFDGARVTTVEPRPGRELDPAAARDALVAAYASAEDDPAELAMVESAPEIDEGDVAQARNDFANPAVSDPVTLTFDDSVIRLEPAAYTPALRLAPVNGELVPRLREKKLADVLDSRVSADGAPVDATVALVDGEPQVVPAKPGVTYDRDQVRSAFLDLVVARGKGRTLEVDAKVARADFTTQDARDLKITEQVSTFTTYYPHADYRNVNLGRAAELIDGTVLEPGETFSLNGTVGERTRANGFTEGFVISNGVYKEELGGGVSQMATTLFNAMFFAGLKDVEHRPHSFYIDRYPVGREATVVWGALDLKFQNDTPYGVLIDASIDPSTPSSSGSVTVTMYSTDYWDITTSTSDRYNLTEPETRVIREEECFPNDGYGGFDIDVIRYFRRAGEEQLHHSETFTTTYTPSDTVVCKPPLDSDS